jgi:hypothetical protein
MENVILKYVVSGFHCTVKPRYNVPRFNVFSWYNVEKNFTLPIDAHVIFPQYNVNFNVTLKNFGPQRNVISRFHCISIFLLTGSCLPAESSNEHLPVKTKKKRKIMIILHVLFEKRGQRMCSVNVLLGARKQANRDLPRIIGNLGSRSVRKLLRNTFHDGWEICFTFALLLKH